MSVKQYVSATTTRNSNMTNYKIAGVILCLYGPKGGTRATEELSIYEAARLRDALDKAIRQSELDARETELRAS